jgi:hypothetical protein
VIGQRGEVLGARVCDYDITHSYELRVKS